MTFDNFVAWFENVSFVFSIHPARAEVGSCEEVSGFANVRHIGTSYRHLF